MDAVETIKDAFYESLVEVLNKTSRNYRILLLGDFNARVGHGEH